MDSIGLNIINPGKYLFRQNPITHWVEVEVFIQEKSNQRDLWVRWLDTEVKIEKLINRGEWKQI